MNFHPLSSLLRLVPPRPHREVVVPLGTTVDCENVTLGSAELSGHVQVCGGTPANRLQMLRLLCTSTLAAGWDVLVVESAPENSRVGPMFGHTHELATQHDVQFHLANSDGHFFDTDGVCYISLDRDPVVAEQVWAMLLNFLASRNASSAPPVLLLLPDVSSFAVEMIQKVVSAAADANVCVVTGSTSAQPDRSSVFNVTVQLPTPENVESQTPGQLCLDLENTPTVPPHSFFLSVRLPFQRHHQMQAFTE